MAEGGRPKLDSHLLECPICLEQLRRAKSLPCLHSFCEDCLGTYITKELSGKMASATSFPCPVCRTLTHPVIQADSKETWAHQFPTNCLVQEMIQLRERTPDSFFCKLCKAKGFNSIPVTVWCKTINAGFCESCKIDVHDVVHSDCTALDVTGYANTGLMKEPSPPKCVKHNEKMDCYCEDHQILGCSKCVFMDHRRCEEVTTAIEYYNKLKNDSKLDHMKKALLKATEVLECLVKDFCEQLEIMMQNQDTALQSITDLRERIDRRLDKLQKDITDSLVCSSKKEKRKVEATSQQCGRLMTGIDTTLKSLAAALERDASTETVLLYQRGQAEVAACKDLVTEMRNSYSPVSITHKIDPSFVTLDNNTRLTFGEVVVKERLRAFPVTPGYLLKPLSERRVNEIEKFNIECPTDTGNCSAFGAVYLPNGHIVIADVNNSKLKLFTDRGRYLDHLMIRGLQNVCLMDKHTVAVAVDDPGGVRIVKVTSSKLALLSEINMSIGEECSGITYTDGKFVVSTGQGNVYSVTLDGTTDLLLGPGFQSYYLACDPNNGYTFVSFYTDTEGDVAVARLSAEKRTAEVNILTVGVVRRATGLDVDLEGNLYICGEGSDNVVQMSGDGRHVRELLTSSDGINSPVGIAVCGEKFVVTSLSEEEPNVVHVYQLY